MENTKMTALGLETAREMIQTLRGTVEGMEMNLAQLQDEKAGLELTIGNLQEENDALTEKVFQLEAMQAEVGEAALESESVPESLQSVEEKLAFYFKDVKQMNPKKLTAEDGETLYNILEYTCKTLKKAGLKL